jgi:hypothetical protein
MSARSTQIVLKSGRSLIISPIRFTDAQLNEVSNHGPEALIAPNCFHHLHIQSASEKLSVTRLFYAEGLQQKRADIKWSNVLSENTWPYSDEVQLICVGGTPKLNEAVFFHKASRTLILTDLFFNLTNLKLTPLTLIYKLMGTFNRPAVSRLIGFLCKDKATLKKDLKRICDLDFENLVMAHGEVINGNAKEIFVNALKERGLY